MDNINFRGGFLIRKPKTITKWNNIQELLPKKKCIIENFNENGDIFVSTKTHYDEYTLDLLLKKKKDVEIVFYPEINLKTRLDSYFPEKSRKVVESQTNVISDRKEQLKYLKDLSAKRKCEDEFVPKKYKWTPEDHIEKTLTLLTSKLDLEAENFNVHKEKGVTIISDKSGKKLALASPNSEKGVNYVYILPKNHDSSPQRFAVHQNGENEELVGLGGIKIFQKNFKHAVHFDMCRIKPQNK